MQLIPTFYILSNESLVRYYAKQDGCAHIKLRHRIRAALVTINFYISTVLFLLCILDLIIQMNLFLAIPRAVLVACCGAYFAFLLGKIRSLYILSIATLLLIGIFTYSIGFWRNL